MAQQAGQAGQARQARQGYVYLIAEKEGGKETGYYKVGTSTDAEYSEKNLSNLQTANPRKLQYAEYVKVRNLDAADQNVRAKLKKWTWINDPTWYFAGQRSPNLKFAFGVAVDPYRI